MIEASVEVKWIPSAKKKVLEAPDKMLYGIAYETLHRTMPNIPKDTGYMRKTSLNGGVKGSSGDYYIGSYTNYASYVWVMGKDTNWTTPNTFGKWYKKVYKTQGYSIQTSVVERNKLK